MWLLTPSRAAAAAPESDEDLVEQFAGLGVRQQQIEAAHTGRDTASDEADEADERELLLWAFHMDALRLFEALRTQWTVVALPMAGLLYQGLRYETLPAVCAPLGLYADDPHLFSQLRRMETAGRRCLNAGEGAL